MGATRKHHRNITFYEVPKQLVCVAFLKTP